MTERSTNPGQETPPGMPRWVKILAITVGALVAIFIVLQLLGVGGEHGPGRHLSGTDAVETALVV